MSLTSLPTLHDAARREIEAVEQICLRFHSYSDLGNQYGRDKRALPALLLAAHSLERMGIQERCFSKKISITKGTPEGYYESFVQNRGISERVHTPWPACHCHSGFHLVSCLDPTSAGSNPKKENKITSVLLRLTTSQDQVRCVSSSFHTHRAVCVFYRVDLLLVESPSPSISVLHFHTSHVNLDDMVAARTEETI